MDSQFVETSLDIPAAPARYAAGCLWLSSLAPLLRKVQAVAHLESGLFFPSQ